MRSRSLAVILLLLLCPFAARSANSCKLFKLAELPVTMSGTRPLIKGSLNGTDALFLADSGAFYSFISSASARQYGLRLSMLPPGMRVGGVGGTVTAQLGVAKDFMLTGLAGEAFHNVAFVVMDDSGLPGLATGPDGPAAVIGQNLLSIFDTEYDLANGYIRLWRSQDCRKALMAYWLRGGEAMGLVKIEPITAIQPHLLGSASLDGSSIRVIFDTGASHSVLVRKAAARLGFKPDNPGVVPAGESHGIGRRYVETWIATFDKLDLNGEQIKNARLQVGDFELPDNADMLLGADFFLSHRIFVASSQHQLYFTYNGGRVFDLRAGPDKQSDTSPAAGDGAADRAATSADGSEAADGSTSTEAPASSNSSQPAPSGGGADGGMDAAAFRRRGAASAGRMDYRAAIADFDQAVRLEPNDAENYLQRATARARLHEAADALSDLDKALSISADNVPALLARGEIRLATKNDSGALADFGHAEAVAPNDFGLSLHVAEIYSATGRFDTALTLFNQWISQHASDSRLGAAMRGRCWVRAVLGKDLNEALTDCNGSARSSGSDAHILQTRGLVWLRLGNFDKAISDYKASLKLQPRDTLARYGLGLAERGKGLNDAGDRDIQAASAESPSVAAFFKRIGLAP